MLNVSEDKGPPFQPGPLRTLPIVGFGEAPRQVSPSRRPAPDVTFNGAELNADGMDQRFYEDTGFKHIVNMCQKNLATWFHKG
jgi:hypothetical protein